MTNSNINNNSSAHEICFGEGSNRICIPIGTGPTFPTYFNNTDEITSLAAGDIHGKHIRESMKRYRKMGNSSHKFWKGELKLLLDKGLIGVNDKLALDEIINILHYKPKINIKRIKAIYQGLVDNDASPISIIISTIAIDSLESNSMHSGVAIADIGGAITGGAIGGIPGAIVGAILASLTYLHQNKRPLNNNIGTFHNIALDLFHKEYSDISTLDFNMVKEEVIELMVNYDSSNFCKSDICKKVAILDKLIVKLDIDTSFKDNKIIYNNFTKIIDHLANENEISSSLCKELSVINAEIYRDSKQEILTQVNELKKMKWRKNDQRYVNTFVQVFNSSLSYWSDHNADFSLNDGNGVILADAAGALYGLLLGPVGSIIYGAGFSLIANN